MSKLFAKLSLNQRLALLAVVLGTVAIGATPSRGERLSVDADEMARLLASRAGRVDPATLADWIIQGRSDYRLVDVREGGAFAAGQRIPTAENIPAATLLDAGLARAEKIVLVGDDDALVGQAWFLLEAAGYKGASILDGGMRAWLEQVVYPRVDGIDAAARAKLEAVSARFGGSPRTGPGAGAMDMLASAAAAPSSVEVPKLPSGAKKPAPAKKREGC